MCICGTRRIGSAPTCHKKQQILGNTESAESASRRRFLASQCALHTATLAAQWWAELSFNPTIRRAWRRGRRTSVCCIAHQLPRLHLGWAFKRVQQHAGLLGVRKRHVGCQGTACTRGARTPRQCHPHARTCAKIRQWDAVMPAPASPTRKRHPLGGAQLQEGGLGGGDWEGGSSAAGRRAGRGDGRGAQLHF